MLALGSVGVNVHQAGKKYIVKFYTLICYQNFGMCDTETFTCNDTVILVDNAVFRSELETAQVSGRTVNP